MNKKDFEMLARELAKVTAMDAPHSYGGTIAAQNIASALVHTNPRFDRARFLKACGVTS